MAICLVIYLALRYIDVIGDAALSVAVVFSSDSGCDSRYDFKCGVASD